MIASDFIYDNIISTLSLNFPVYSSAGIASPDSYAHIMDVGGSSNPKWLRDVYVVKIYGIYNVVDYELGMADFEIINNNILGHPNITDVDGNEWCLFNLRQAPFFLGVDDIGRYLYTMEFEVTKDSLTGVHREPII